MMATRRSHPPALLRIVERTIREEGLVTRGDRIVVGVSGGPDSMALAHALWILRDRLGIEPIAVGVDHGLRREAGAELDIAQAFLGGLGMGFERAAVQVGHGGNLMARAREARYGVLRDAGARLGAAAIAIGHHADDRAETVLIRLLQGAGPGGLAVLPARLGELIRPMIRATRADVMLHVERHAVPFSQDPSNLDTRHLRAAVRAEVMPLLQRFDPQVVKHLCDLAEDLAVVAGQEASRGPVLKRSQWKALAQAASGRSTVRVALAGGRTARVDAKTGVISVEAPSGGPRGWGTHDGK